MFIQKVMWIWFRGIPQTFWAQHRFSAFWLRSRCSICSYQLNIWYGGHVPPSILNWFLQGDEVQELAPASSRVGLALQYRQDRPTSPLTPEDHQLIIVIDGEHLKYWIHWIPKYPYKLAWSVTTSLTKPETTFWENFWGRLLIFGKSFWDTKYYTSSGECRWSCFCAQFGWNWQDAISRLYLISPSIQIET